MDRFTSMGISNDAREFLAAAQIVRSQKPATFAPVYFLACQSIELSLKAYLRASGYSDEKLRSIGHNLEKCVEAAKFEGIEAHLSFSDVDFEAIAFVSPYYLYRDFQYSTSGYKSFAHVDSLIALGDRVWQALREFCVQHREYHFGKPTAIV